MQHRVDSSNWRKRLGWTLWCFVGSYVRNFYCFNLEGNVATYDGLEDHIVFFVYLMSSILLQ